MLLIELSKKFPIPQIPFPEQKPEEDKNSNKNETTKDSATIKQEPNDPSIPTPANNSTGPPEKKIKINN